MSNLRLKIIVSLYSIDQLYNDTCKNKINQILEKGAPSMMNKTYAPIKVIFVPSLMREALISPEDESLVDAAGRPKRILVKDPETLATLLNPNDFLDFVHFNFTLATLEGAYAKPFGDMVPYTTPGEALDMVSEDQKQAWADEDLVKANNDKDHYSKYQFPAYQQIERAVFDSANRILYVYVQFQGQFTTIVNQDDYNKGLKEVLDALGQYMTFNELTSYNVFKEWLHEKPWLQSKADLLAGRG